MTYGLSRNVGDLAPGGGVVVLEADAVEAGRFAQKLSKARLRPGLDR